MYNKCTQYRTNTSSKYNGPTTDDGDTGFRGDEEPQDHLYSQRAETSENYHWPTKRKTQEAKCMVSSLIRLDADSDPGNWMRAKLESVIQSEQPNPICSDLITIAIVYCLYTYSKVVLSVRA